LYNRIIGHYEVPLTHPGRDRERGRIWRVVYKGGEGMHSVASQAPSAAATRKQDGGGAASYLHDRKIDLTTASVEQLVNELADPNLTWRMLAMNQIVDRLGPDAVASLNNG